MQPLKKCTFQNDVAVLSEMTVFRMLDTLRPTSPGPDGLPTWFLKISAPSFCTPLTFLYNVSILMSFVPSQWKNSSITPVPETSRPIEFSDYRPISVTSILARILERFIVKLFFYPILNHPNYSHLFSDQFAFRPTGSTTAALIKLVHLISTLLKVYPYVHLIALDFSKAFDTVRHYTLLTKIAEMPLVDSIYNWLKNYLRGREHCTKFRGETSLNAKINASIVQGSGVGPVSYVLNASDLQTLLPDNHLNKYADDTYLAVPSKNSTSIDMEMKNIGDWATQNNLKLNHSKSIEMIIHRPRSRTQGLESVAGTAGIKRVGQMSILGVILKDDLSFEEHVNKIVAQSAQQMYALRVLKSHGLQGHDLWDVTRSILLARMMYASQAWFGLLKESEAMRLQAILKRAIKQGLLPKETKTFAEMCDIADKTLFKNIQANRHHVLYNLLPPIKLTPYSLRPRIHNREIPAENDYIVRKKFVFRMIYKDIF